MKFSGVFRILLVSSFLLSLSAPVGAQSVAVKAGARAAAESGFAAFQAQDYEKALDYFIRAEQSVHAPPHLLFIARSQEKLGKLVGARESYLKILQEELGEDAPSVFLEAQQDAERELEALEPRVPRVNIAVQGASASEVELLVDGQPVPSSLVGIPLPIDPGEHTLEARGPGLQSPVVKVAPVEGETLEATLVLEAVPQSSGSLAVAPSEGDAQEGKPNWTSGLAIGGYSALGVGVIGGVLGAVFFSRAAKDKKAADELFACDDTASGCSDAQVRDIGDFDDDADSKRTIGIAGVAVAGAGVVTGTVLLILNAGKKQPVEQAVVRPWVGFGQVGLSGTF